ncbi:nucleoside 2-deoxyribosyltransferase [Candidimonas nitroreducens]|uniref:Nucleoside 2-deoxyribosyltransferase n=1 Tax=Candidimonas nitroreducens TaxID=683354 RepID=A0A225MTF6_9BURK|nr:nucleoside 2-deoxyribosyltransferase [Candidimonas nitroreducens]OWT63743.1 nucleoside 2-deoxyribosyltransferase [Candidimonas nitroreducens]
MKQDGIAAQGRAAARKAKTIYLAGYDVFRADALEHGERLQQACLRHGYTGLYPLDNAAPPDLAGRALAQWICAANIGLLRRADRVMANLNPFRGAEPDSGTVFEVGYAAALGKPVWVYTGSGASLVEQVAAGRDGARAVDAQGYTVEDFGLNLNLMIACSAQVVVGDAEDCLRAMARAEPGRLMP